MTLKFTSATDCREHFYPRTLIVFIPLLALLVSQSYLGLLGWSNVLGLCLRLSWRGLDSISWLIGPHNKYLIFFRIFSLIFWIKINTKLLIFLDKRRVFFFNNNKVLLETKVFYLIFFFKESSHVLLVTF